MERYLAFYTDPPIWIDCYINPHNDKKNYLDKINEPCIKRENEKFSIIMSFDGIIGINIKDLTFPNSLENSPEETFLACQKYSQFGLLIKVLLSEYININSLNCFIYIEEIPIKAFGVIKIDENNKIIGTQHVTLSYFNQIYQKRRFLDYQLPTAGLIVDPVYDNINIFPINVLDELNNKLLAIFKTENIDIYFQLVKSLADYKMGNYTISLTNSWFIIERLLNNKWEKCLNKINIEIDENKKRINRDRMKNLTDGNNFTISTIINIMELNGEISFNDFEILDKIRKKRNKIAHENEQFNDAGLCADCFRQINKLFEEIFWPSINIDHRIQVRVMR